MLGILTGGCYMVDMAGAPSAAIQCVGFSIYDDSALPNNVCKQIRTEWQTKQIDQEKHFLHL